MAHLGGREGHSTCNQGALAKGIHNAQPGYGTSPILPSPDDSLFDIRKLEKVLHVLLSILPAFLAFDWNVRF